MDLLETVGRAMAVALGVYGILRLQDLARRGVLPTLRHPSYEGGMFLLEVGLGVLLPIVLLAIPKVRMKEAGLVTSAFLAVLGFVMHRLNVSITGMERAAGVRYFPSWMEVAVSLALVAVGFAIFGWAVQYLPIFHEGVHRPRAVEAPAWLLAKTAPTLAGGAPGSASQSGRPGRAE
jgi:Ni/Fe-hydrogenase subunit HybB-like protein